MKTTEPDNRLDFNNWARYITAEYTRMAYGYRPRILNKPKK